jgi:hypothetical protein
VLPDRFANGDTANDTGGIAGGRLKSGFDPADKGFYHGGDIKGLIARLDYIKGMGFTAVWVGPVFKNKAVQGAPGQESAGYHGYWITDFTQVDPHFGTNAEFAALVSAAHARGLKVYMDIVVNHTADVIQYREVPAGTAAAYRDKADYPYSRKGGLAGPAINAGFAGDEDSTEANFAHLTDPAYAYTPFIPKGEEHAKVPDWLNNPLYYHNRGDSTFSGENSRFGDFSGLDDVFTEHPRVRAGMIAIYGDWIRKFHIDGFRIDTARHVDPRFWQAFIPAMQGSPAPRAFPISRSSAKWRARTRITAISPASPGAMAIPTCSISPSTPRFVPCLPRTRALMCWPTCSMATCSIRAARKPRWRNRRSSITTTSAALPGWWSTTGPASARTNCWPAPRWRTPCCSPCGAARWSIMATNRAWSATATTRPRGRTCSPARCPATTTSRCSAPPAPPRRTISTPTIRFTS